MDFKAAEREAERLDRYAELLRYQSADQKSHAVRIRAGIAAYRESMDKEGFPVGKEPTLSERVRVFSGRFLRLFRSGKSSEGVTA